VAVGLSGSQTWRAAGTAALLLAAFGVVSTAQEVAHADTAAPKPGRYCGAKAKFHGNDGGWTYAEVTPCLRVQAGSKGDIQINVSEVQYHWGSAWYYPTTTASDFYNWSAEGSVTAPRGEKGKFYTSRGGGSFDLRTPSSSNYSGFKGEFYKDVDLIKTCGTYNVSMHYDQSGPHWHDANDKYAIKQDKNFVIQVPCAT
jgi:hypothetical protein